MKSRIRVNLIILSFITSWVCLEKPMPRCDSSSSCLMGLNKRFSNIGKFSSLSENWMVITGFLLLLLLSRRVEGWTYHDEVQGFESLYRISNDAASVGVHNQIDFIVRMIVYRIVELGVRMIEYNEQVIRGNGSDFFLYVFHGRSCFSLAKLRILMKIQSGIQKSIINRQNIISELSESPLFLQHEFKTINFYAMETFSISNLDLVIVLVYLAFIIW